MKSGTTLLAKDKRYFFNIFISGYNKLLYSIPSTAVISAHTHKNSSEYLPKLVTICSFFME